MINCPKCNESLGDNVLICPFCRHEFTDEERLVISKAKLEEAQNRSAEEYKRGSDFSYLRLIWQLGTIAIAVLTILAFNILKFADLSQAALVVLIVGFALLLIENVYFLLIKKANNCPHCGGYLSQSYGNKCQWCGGKIR